MIRHEVLDVMIERRSSDGTVHVRATVVTETRLLWCKRQEVDARFFKRSSAGVWTFETGATCPDYLAWKLELITPWIKAPDQADAYRHPE